MDDERDLITMLGSLRIVGLEDCMSIDRTDLVTILHASISPALRKVVGARWLLQQFREHQRSEARALLYLECFVTTLRSATFALQKMGTSTKGFNRWYAERVKEMRADPQLRWLVRVRNAAEKEGLFTTHYGPRVTVRVYRDGTQVAEPETPLIRVDGIHSEDIIADLSAGLEKIASIVDEAHRLFFSEPQKKELRSLVRYLKQAPDGSWHDLKVEDFEAALVPFDDSSQSFPGATRDDGGASERRDSAAGSVEHE